MNSSNTITFTELLTEYVGEYIPYGLLLSTVEWRNKRKEILIRDNHKCTQCGCWTTERMWNSKKRENFYIWWREDKPVIVKNEDGTHEEILLPEMISAPKQYYLNIHHKYYIKNRLPWSYPPDTLTTLCNWCHEELHKNELIKVYDEDNNELTDLTPCRRCDGAGWFPEYDHVEAGICFHCRGAKYEELINVRVER
jgi:5-methylcytosine-specific restriction endonuclease McrA